MKQTAEEKAGNALGLAALIAIPVFIGLIFYMRKKR
jgi:hypothetical protein